MVLQRHHVRGDHAARLTGFLPARGGEHSVGLPARHWVEDSDAEALVEWLWVLRAPNPRRAPCDPSPLVVISKAGGIALWTAS